jgi:hypothetical protein
VVRCLWLCTAELLVGKKSPHLHQRGPRGLQRAPDGTEKGTASSPSAPPGAFDSDLNKPKPGCSAQGRSWPGRLTIPLVVKVPHSSDAETASPRPILSAAKLVQGGLRVAYDRSSSPRPPDKDQQVTGRALERVAELRERIAIDSERAAVPDGVRRVLVNPARTESCRAGWPPARGRAAAPPRG